MKKEHIHKFFIYPLTWISPVLNAKILFRFKYKRALNLKNPTGFDEKIQWLKLNRYNHDPLVKMCADKYKVREYLASLGLEELQNELYNVYHRAKDIDWNALPDKFVLKWNFGAGFNLICRDKSKLNIARATQQLARWGKRKIHLYYGEMQYKTDKVIVAEKLLETKKGELPSDYKIYCFNGKPLYIMLCVGRDQGKPKFYFFNRAWELQRINRAGLALPSGENIEKPEGVDRLFDYAEKLSAPFPFVRVDFYLVDGKAYFGELTFTPAGGFDTNRLPETDAMFGKLIDLTRFSS